MKYDRSASLSQELEGKIEQFQESVKDLRNTHGRDKRTKDKLKRAVQVKAKPLLEGTQRHLVYHELCWQDKNAADDELRSQFASSDIAQEPAHRPGEAIWETIARPEVKMERLPPYSAVFRLSLALDKPYLSRDENLFYIIDNPVRREKVFGQPYVAASSWKGSLRSALRCLDDEKYSDDKEIMRRLFGNERGTEEQERIRSGRLYFYHTFWDRVGLEVINPHDRATRAGRQPIYLECARTGSQGLFTLLYVPFDRMGLRGEEEERKTVEQVGQDLQAVALGLQAMLTIYGFGAKTSSGYGLAKDGDLAGSLEVNVIVEPVEEQPVQLLEQQSLPRYLETPDRLIEKFCYEDGSFREYLAGEMASWSKPERQLYEKARNWWKREGERLHELQRAGSSAHEPDVLASKPEPQYFSCQFSIFSELEKCTSDFISALEGGVK
jgi:CRISPR-associated protein Cmr2